MNDMANPEQLDAPAENNVSREDLTEAVRATALLADLTVSLWSGERTDRTLSDKIKDDAGAIGNTGRYLKNLLAGCDNQLKAVRGAYAGARHVHYKLTLPWVNNPSADRQTGPRLLPNLLFERYLTEMSKLKRDANHQLDQFVDAYPDLIVRAQANLAGLAKPEDYPTQEQVRALFKLSFDFTPIPAATAFTGLPDGMIERLGAQLRKRQEAAVAASQATMWERVRTSVGHLVERLTDPEKIFKSVTIDGVKELIVLLPGFNCAGDDRVTTVVEDIKRMLHDVSAEQLRKNESVRSDVVKQAHALNAKLDKWGL
jgi:hypothetical protein